MNLRLSCIYDKMVSVPCWNNTIFTLVKHFYDDYLDKPPPKKIRCTSNVMRKSQINYNKLCTLWIIYMAQCWWALENCTVNSIILQLYYLKCCTLCPIAKVSGKNYLLAHDKIVAFAAVVYIFGEFNSHAALL